jgi:nitroreductase
MPARPPATTDSHAIRDGLVDAVTAAGYAPSIHDTQPWRWRVGSDTLDLYLDHSRVRKVTDPDARLATQSCGAALHHARTVLAAESWHTTVARMPDAADQDHLATVRVYAPAPADPTAADRVRTIPLRRTDRGPVAGAPVSSEQLRAITVAVVAEGAWLHVLPADQVIDLAASADRAGTSESVWRAELAQWAESARRDRAAVFAILYGRSDEPRDWLRAGEALSAAWLTATERGISVLPLSAPVEVLGTRETMRRQLSYLSHPFLVLRLHTVDPAEAARAPRSPTDQTIE